MVSFQFKNCTRALDSNIHSARIRYAQERLEFHSFFSNLTVAGIQEALRAPRMSIALHEKRKSTVARLFRAQQQDPHDLWTLLLVQACETQLVDRRLAISKKEDERLDALVLVTFMAVLADLPWSVEHEDMQSYALRTSGTALRHALRTGSAPKRTTTVHGNVVRMAGRSVHPQLTLITTPDLTKPEAK